uniref:Bm6037, isoform b n=1 Tax=Brugia malayi TaxID=6279 RepID=A0A1I9G0U9_BRUMA|nr:Bm6037, isoform b [Brugia malayi]
MMIVKPAALFSAFVSTVYTLQNPLISAPFDNFRIECAKSSGAVGISVRMVGSQGFIRQDTVFAIICERVDELYPWHGIPISIAELEREDCYYSHLFDPVVDTESLYTCRPREYISGITRLSDTRVQVLCCRLRTRDEANCQEKEFTKPIGFDPRTDIYHRKQLINSIAVEGHNYRVRFCDLAPRAIALIYNDLLITTTITTETPKNNGYHAEAESDMLNTATARNKYTKNNLFERLTSQATTSSSTTKHVIQIFRPSSLYNLEEVQNMRNTSTSSPNHSQKMQQTSREKFSTIMNTVDEKKRQSTAWMIDEISKQNSALPTVSFVPTRVTQQFQSYSVAAKQDVSSGRNRTAMTLSYFATSSLQTTTASPLILLKPLTSKTVHTKVTSKNKQPTTKASKRRRMKQTLSPTISSNSSRITPQLTTSSAHLIELENTTESPSLLSTQLRRDFSSGTHIDEETKYSPFENRDSNPSRDNEAFGSEYLILPTSANPLDMTTSSDSFLYKISNEILHAPVKSFRKQIGVAYSEFKSFPNKQTNKVDHEFNFPSFGDGNIEDVGLDYSEYNLSMKKSADGSRTYVPENQEPLNAPSAAIVYDASKQKNAVLVIARRKKKKVQQNDQESNQEQKNDADKELLSMNDEVNSFPMDTYNSASSTVSSKQDLEFPTTSSSPANLKNTAEDVYDPAKFYRTVPPKRPTQTEKVLTFCTKEIAIRDRHNLVIACGSETEIWQPFRCPAGSECFSSTDSSYRICCAVAEIYLC